MDTTTKPHSKCSCSKRFYLPCSFKRSCCFFLTFVLLIVLVLGLTALVIFVVLKPQKPLFSIQTAKIESYRLDMEPKKDLFVSSFLSLTLNASNPNRVGITYGTSRLHVLVNGLVIGMIRIPQFHQPPQSKNISVQAQVIFECVNVSELTSGNFMDENSKNGLFQIRILGDIKAQVRILRVTLPKLKVCAS